ncbi:MAG: C2 family cysteine protease, partial [Betaproteobacteria bacterium]
MGERLDFLDPVQGNVPDCGLMSALIASAFVDPDALRQRLAGSGFSAQRPAHALPFFAADRPTEVLVQTEFPVTAADGPIYARSAEGRESWPALIEKAYAMWSASPVISWSAATPDVDNIDAATYQVIGHQSLKDVLAQLWGRDADDFTSDAFFARLVSPQANPPLVKRATGVAVRPVAAWTYL